MAALMDDALGIGLAATQVGRLHRLLVYRVEPDSPVQALVNPRDRVALEGRGGLRGGLPEPAPACSSTSSARSTCACARRTSDGEPIVVEASGLEARVIQHEMDHLDGVLILDRAAARPAPRGDARPARAGRRPPRSRGRRAHRLPRHVATSRPPCCAGSPQTPAPPALVVTRPDRPAGRGRRLARRRSPTLAAELGIELVQPEDVNAPEARERIAAARARTRARAVRVRRADQGAAAVRARDPQRAPVAAAALARRGAGRAGDHGRRRARPASRSCG